MQDLKQNLSGLLKAYRSEKRQACLLRCELERPVMITPQEQLEVMAYSRGDIGSVPTAGHVSDKTYHIAMNYQQQSEHLNRIEAADISMHLEQLERKLYRLEYCVSQLPDDLSTVIKALYFDGKSERGAAADLNLGVSTVKRRLSAALDELVEMYDVLQRNGVILNW